MEIIKKEIKLKLLPRLPNLIAFFISSYLIWLFITDNNQYYINQDYFIFNFLMGIILFVVSGASLVIGYGPSNLRNYLPLILILILGFGLEPQPLSSATASQRSVNVGGAATESQVSPLLNQDPTLLRITDWVKLQGFEADYSRFEGQGVDVIGFVFRSKGQEQFSPDNFYVGRFVITCCAVDATPLGLEVDINSISEFPGENEWVRLSGNWKVEEKEGVQYLVVVADDIEIVERPDTPYE